MRKLFIHVGTHKTGTTSLQAYLLDNAGALRSSGVEVFTETHRKFGQTANCFSLASAVLRPSLKTVARMTGDASKSGFWHLAKSKMRIKHILSSSTASSFILSAEAFCFARTDTERIKILKLLDHKDIEVIPVVCFRNQENWRESWFSELETWRPRFKQPFGEGMDDIRGDWYFDVDAIYNFWSKIGPVRVLDFDEAVKGHQSIIGPILQSMEIDVIGDIKGYFLRSRD